MKSGKEILEARAVETGIILGDSIPMPVFSKLGLPAVVACTGCGMTMVVTSCLIDDNGFIWCRDCAGDGQKEGESLLFFCYLKLLVG